MIIQRKCRILRLYFCSLGPPGSNQRQPLISQSSQNERSRSSSPSTSRSRSNSNSHHHVTLNARASGSGHANVSITHHHHCCSCRGHAGTSTLDRPAQLSTVSCSSGGAGQQPVMAGLTTSALTTSTGGGQVASGAAQIGPDEAVGSYSEDMSTITKRTADRSLDSGQKFLCCCWTAEEESPMR